MLFYRHQPIFTLIILINLLLLTACAAIGSQATPTPNTSLFENEEIPPPPELDSEKIAQGKALYIQYCATCHKANGEGDPDWKIRNEDGSFNPPPHDSSGHTWHHDDDLLIDIITNGSSFPDTKMPVYKDQLSKEEVEATLEYIKSWWGSEERQIQWERTWYAQQQ